jgi:hypothetical protein
MIIPNLERWREVLAMAQGVNIFASNFDPVCKSFARIGLFLSSIEI